ncbi:hypothetical protein [Caulobacter sp.]|uniref:hypothetical protein n=1 Tax=Caulobacter sp. TaxID=78 RepID=UPI001B198833|nr:hypothetical protein [Caulobacter sp.]MBO9544305.1 hypothetical protein [Caulobacter sp.]
MEKIEARKVSREEIAQRIMAGCFVLGGLVGGAFALATLLHWEIPLWLIGGVLVVLMVLLVPVTIIYWRMIDEAAREAHKFAWFWGGQGGMLIALGLGLLGDSEKLVAAYGDLKAAGWMFVGMLALLICQIVGYGLAWAGWWLIRQR